MSYYQASWINLVNYVHRVRSVFLDLFLRIRFLVSIMCENLLYVSNLTLKVLLSRVFSGQSSAYLLKSSFQQSTTALSLIFGLY